MQAIWSDGDCSPTVRGASSCAVWCALTRRFAHGALRPLPSLRLRAGAPRARVAWLPDGCLIDPLVAHLFAADRPPPRCGAPPELPGALAPNEQREATKASSALTARTGCCAACASARARQGRGSRGSRTGALSILWSRTCSRPTGRRRVAAPRRSCPARSRRMSSVRQQKRVLRSRRAPAAAQPAPPRGRAKGAGRVAPGRVPYRSFGRAPVRGRPAAAALRRPAGAARRARAE